MNVANLLEGTLADLDVMLLESSRRGASLFRRAFPDEGPLRRELYPKHVEFFSAGAQHRERILIAANRVGKTFAGAYELTAHLTGDYPAWWTGRRFHEPVLAWAAGDTSKTVRDIVQVALLGPPGQHGTGMIPAHRIERTTTKSGIPDALESVWVRHNTGRASVLTLKSYDQRREAFQGSRIHVVWMDEEAPEDIWTEAVLRTAETPDFVGGIVYLTFTPLMGLTPLVLSFLPGGRVEAHAVTSSPSAVQ